MHWITTRDLTSQDRISFWGTFPTTSRGRLIRRYLELPQKPEVTVLMVQLEVAERIIAPPGHLSAAGGERSVLR